MGAELDEDIYAQLKSLASRIHSERGFGQQTLDATSLLHEAWEKIARAGSETTSRQHFVAVAARAMRQVLIDRARARSAQKRGQDPVRTTLTGLSDRALEPEELLAMDEALEQLRTVDETAADVVLLRAFGGATALEAADHLGVSRSTIDRAWRFGRAFLVDRLG